MTARGGTWKVSSVPCTWAGCASPLNTRNTTKARKSLLRMKDSPLYRKMLAHAEKSDLGIWLFQIVNQAIADGQLNKSHYAGAVFQASYHHQRDDYRIPD